MPNIPVLLHHRQGVQLTKDAFSHREQCGAMPAGAALHAGIGDDILMK